MKHQFTATCTEGSTAPQRNAHCDVRRAVWRDTVIVVSE